MTHQPSQPAVSVPSGTSPPAPAWSPGDPVGLAIERDARDRAAVGIDHGAGLEADVLARGDRTGSGGKGPDLRRPVREID